MWYNGEKFKSEFTGERMKDKVIGDEILIGRWFYQKPNLIPDENGTIVLIAKRSFGPLEIYEWGIDRKGKPYEMYQWCENDFFENESYIKNISHAELKLQIDIMMQFAIHNKLSDWIPLYEKANEFLYSSL